MAPSFANMPPHACPPRRARASFIAEQLERLSAESAARTANAANPAAAPAQSAKQSDSAPLPQQPKPKKVRATPVAAAKNVLRAAKAVSAKSLASPSVRRNLGEGGAPSFVHHPPDLARHRRKCALCHHPDREIIEDLFIHWHSPESIVRFYNEDDDNDLTWVSIYRHAYAFGLDEIRRRNLRFVFEHLLEQADQITPTSATVIAAARALGSCVSDTGQWNDPPKRVLVTNIVRNEQLDASDDSAFAGAPSFAPSAKGGTFPACHVASASAISIPEMHEKDSSFPVSSPHDSAPTTAAPSEEAFVGADRIYRPTSPSAAETDGGPAASEETESDNRDSSFRVSSPHDSAPITPAPSEEAFVGADRIHRPVPPSAKDSLVDAPVAHCHSERGCDEHPTSLPAAGGESAVPWFQRSASHRN
jgi:hypothetical protein